MNWEDERYVRLYVRDTGDWVTLSWDAQALFVQILRKVDRAGVLQFGKHGIRSLAAVIGHREMAERLAPALDELLADGCIQMQGDCIIVPNFIEAQEAKQSDKQRQSESRLRRRDLMRKGLDPDAREAVIYFVQSEHGGPIKIGRADDLAKRMVGLQTSRPDKLVVLAAAQGTVELERQLHARFADIREKGEWFSPTPELMELIRDVSSRGHVALSQFVTGHSVPSRAVPSHATPNQTEEKAPAAQAPVSPAPGLPGIDPGTQEKPSKQPKAKRAGGVTQEVAALAETLLAELSAAIQRVRPGARLLRPIPGNVEHIAARLADGATAEEVRHVIAVCEAESRHNEKSLQYFNAVSPFRRDNFGRHLARTLEDAAKPDRARGAWRDPTVGSNTGQHTPEQEWDAWRR